MNQKFANKNLAALLPLVLALVLVLALTGCGGNGNDNQSANQTANQTANQNQEASTPDPITPSPDGEVHELVMSFMTWVLPGDTQQIQDAMNEILIPRYGISVELLIMDAASYQQNIRLMLTAGEQVDVMSTLFAGFVHLQSQGFLLDLEANNLLQNFSAFFLRPNVIHYLV